MAQDSDSLWKRDLYRLILLNALGHGQHIGARFAMLLYAVKLQASPAMMGALIAVNSLLPTLTSVQAGKMLDRRDDLRAPMLACSVLLCVGVTIPYFWSSIAALFVMCVINGTSFNLYRIATQQLIGRLGPASDRPANYTSYSMAMATANVFAPMIAGFSIDHLGVANVFLIFAAIGLAPTGAILARAVSFKNTHSPGETESHHKGGSSWDLLRNPSLRRVLIAGVVLMAAWDVFSFMVPIFGSQLQFSASQIGMCAGAFYAGSFFIRIWTRPLLHRFTQWQLLIMSMAGGCVLFMVYPLLHAFSVLLVVSFVLGSGLGMTQPMTMSLSYDEAPPNRKGEVIGLRLTLTHGLQIIIPLLSGALGSAFGLEVAYWFAATILLLGCWSARREWSRSKGSARA